MSYDIVYKKQFLKIDDKIIPLALTGCNNCTEYHNGKNRRSRDWSAIYFNGSNQMIALTPNAIMDKVQGYIGGEYQQHFMKNSKWVDDKGLINFFVHGIKNAKTIEELKEAGCSIDISGYFSIWNGSTNTIENQRFIYNSEDLRKFLSDSKARIEKADKENIYVCLRYTQEDFQPKTVEQDYQKERLVDYFTISVDNNGYLIKTTARRIRYNVLGEQTKQFKTEKLANNYLEKLVKRGFRSNLAVKHIIETEKSFNL